MADDPRIAARRLWGPAIACVDLLRQLAPSAGEASFEALRAAF